VRRSVTAVRTIATSPEFRGIVRRVLDTDPIGTLPRRLWGRSPAMQNKLLRRFGSSPAVVYRPAGGGDDRLVYSSEPGQASAAKAAREIGYEPLVSRERAMALKTEARSLRAKQSDSASSWQRFDRLVVEAAKFLQRKAPSAAQA